MEMGNKRTIIASTLAFLIFVFAPVALVLAKTHNSPPGLQRQNDPGKAVGKKLLLEPRGNKFKVTELDEEGEEVEDSEVPDELGELQIGADLEGEEEGRLIIVKAQGNAAFVISNKLAAQTNFPLMVNLDTNELIVNTPKGSKIVTVLPDAAVANMLAANVLDQLGGKGGLLWLKSQPTPTATISATPTATASATPTLVEEPTPTATDSGEPTATPSGEATITVESLEDTPIRLVLTDDGVLAYEINGIKIKKFLGIFKIKLNRVVFVSAETGELLFIKQNFLTRVLDTLSF